MTLTPPPLPMRFPCWCRAVYSWGGESKNDLGFIEGDLIECLNAGDGSWWTGKLRRNKTVGVFPSNFVEVLPDDFRPVNRQTSPLPASISPSPSNAIQKSKSKPFRKPFEAYSKAPHYTTAKQPEIIRDAPVRRPTRDDTNGTVRKAIRERAVSPAPPSSQMRSHISRAPSPAPSRHDYGARGPSPVPPRHDYDYGSRGPSPVPPRHDYGARGPSPAPSMHSHDARGPSPSPYGRGHYDQYSRGPSPQPYQIVPYQGQFRAASPLPPRHDHYSQRGPSPAPPQPNHYAQRGHSPAPSVYSQDYRAASPAPPHNQYRERSVSPAPPLSRPYDYRSHSPAPTHYDRRTPSPAPSIYKPYRPGAEIESSPPPPPPPHRHATQRGASNGSFQQAPHTPRAPSPVPTTPGLDGFTPSPLREAMDGVMEQLDALSLPRSHESSKPAVLDPWSPESFDMVREHSRKKGATARPQTTMALTHHDSGYESQGADSSQLASNHKEHVDEKQNLPQLNNYVRRMETRLRKMHNHSRSMSTIDDLDQGPPPPPKEPQSERPKSSMGDRKVNKQKSAYDIGRQVLGRTATTKTNSTNASTNTQSTNRSLMSGISASGISATSAGSLARKSHRARSALGFQDVDEDLDEDRPTTPFTGVSYHPSHSSSNQRPQSQAGYHDDGISGLGGLVQLGEVKPKKSNFIKRILEATKTGVASGRSSIATSAAAMHSSTNRPLTSVGMSSMSGGASTMNLNAARDMGLGNGVDWVQVRRDVNRSNTLSKIEKSDRRDRCQMLDYPAIDPVEELYESIEGDEGADGDPVRDSVNFQIINLSLVDKNSRFISNLPQATNAVSLATNYVCRPYRSEVQRLRAIFTWVAEKIRWEEDYEGDVDTRRVISSGRGCAEEYAVLVQEMCTAVGIHSEVVHGYLKSPGEVPELNFMPRPNHWWNAVVIDNEWRMIDCCLASPSNPRRGLYVSTGSNSAEPWWFLTRPTELCWTHIPDDYRQQHICPPVAHETLLNLPCSCPPYFKNSLALVDYNTSLTRIEELEMVHVKFNVPGDVEVVAEVEARAVTRDADGDFFESGETVKKRALAQAEWFNGVKRYTVKALMPGDEGTGVLKIYAGKRGLMHSIKDNPHPMAFALPINHVGANPPYEFVTRHPTPHAQRNDIYVVQPQCQRLALNNTFVFMIRQHPAMDGGGSSTSSASGAASPIPFARPGSAMSMTSSMAASNPSSASGSIAGRKPAKLAIQTPAGKILRLMRKEERQRGIGVGGRPPIGDEEGSDGGTWETIIKCSEKGTWRGLVLADRTARWCVFAEWVCMG
ncbi:kyphoscoliosis peptidase [Microdochium nivale]|nr:kyphoscoliosis peptidase [Microdochium nivale]